MADTGERYAAARRALLSSRPVSSSREWAAQPEVSDDAVREGTGQSWDQWCAQIEQDCPGETDHTVIATHLHEVVGVDVWWAQTITIGFERITGLRLPYQRPDGTFTAGSSRTVRVDATLLRSMLLDDDGRADLFPTIATELRSRPTSKAIRVAMTSGVAQIALTPVSEGRVKVSIQHNQLPRFDDVEHWKGWWSAWLDALEEPDLG